MRTAIPRASRSPMLRWPRSPSSVTRFTASGTTPPHPTSSHLEAVIPRHTLRGPMNPNRLAETEDTLAHTDRLWRSEMKRVYGADGVLVYGFSQAGRGKDGSRIRQAFDARQISVNAWRHERRPQV